MPITYKFKVSVEIKTSTATKTIYPIVEAYSETEAREIAKAQYSTGKVVSVTKIG